MAWGCDPRVVEECPDASEQLVLAMPESYCTVGGTVNSTLSKGDLLGLYGPM